MIIDINFELEKRNLIIKICDKYNILLFNHSDKEQLKQAEKYFFVDILIK